MATPKWEDTEPYSPSKHPEYQAEWRTNQKNGMMSGAEQSLVNLMKSDKSVGRKAWESLTIPAQASREGLDQLAAMVPYAEPTGNPVRDVALNTPKIAAETLAETAPDFVNRLSLASAGVLKGAQKAAPLVKYAGRGLGKMMEGYSGISGGLRGEGALNTAWNDPSLIFSKGKKIAGPLYEAAKQELGKGNSLFSNMYEPKEIVNKTIEYLGKGGQLEAAESHTARKAVDTLLKSKGVVKDELLALRDTLDEIAKSSENISEADKLFKRGLQADALRNLVPYTQSGKPALFRTAAMKYAPFTAALFSPLVQGAGATLGGLAGRNIVSPMMNNPLSGAIMGSLRNFKKKREASK